MTDIDRAALLALAERVEGLAGHSNEIDVLVQVALHAPLAPWDTVRSNSAGTKVIYGMEDGSEKTYWARAWTVSASERKRTAAALRARLKEIEHG